MQDLLRPFVSNKINRYFFKFTHRGEEHEVFLEFFDGKFKKADGSSLLKSSQNDREIFKVQGAISEWIEKIEAGFSTGKPVDFTSNILPINKKIAKK